MSACLTRSGRWLDRIRAEAWRVSVRRTGGRRYSAAPGAPCAASMRAFARAISFARRRF